MGTGTATPLVPPPHGSRGPRTPYPGRPCRGNHGGRGRRRAHTPPSLLPRSRLGEGGREGTGRGRPGVGGSLVWRRAGGLFREGGAGSGRRAGRGGFPEPCRCGAQGPDVQRGGEGWWGRLGRDAVAAPAVSGLSGWGLVLGPGRGGGGCRLPESLALRGSQPSG